MRPPRRIDPEVLLAEDMGMFFADPLGWVMYSFPWDTDTSIQMVELEEPWASRYNCKYGPDRWFCEFLDELGQDIQGNGFNGKDPVQALQYATSSGHGIGKSAGTAMLILFIMSTRPFAKGIVTANTSDQLRTKTWSELGKWRKKCITGHWFEYNNAKGNMNMYHRDHKESWRVDGQTCREENSESFAGLHAANSSPFYIFDEASAIPDKIWEVAEGGLTDGEPFWFAFGNPTRNSGRFRECFRKFRHRWKTRHIDSRSVSITNKDLIANWLKDYGEDSDFFKVRVRGVFPAAGDIQFIGQDLVDMGMAAKVSKRQVMHAPVVLGVDPAWTGNDEFAIYLRRGLLSKFLGSWQKTDDDVRMAKIVADLEDQYEADAVHVDFGYGTGLVSVGRSWGRAWRLVNFAGKSSDPGMLNKRGEIWNALRSWLKEGGSIDDQQLADELVMPEYKVRLDGKIVLESKDEMKKRGLPSPNRADALALTFAFPVAKKTMGLPGAANTGHHVISDYDPFG